MSNYWLDLEKKEEQVGFISPYLRYPITGRSPTRGSRKLVRKYMTRGELFGAKTDDPWEFDPDKYLAKLLKNESRTTDNWKTHTTLDLIREHVIGIQVDGSPLCGNYEKFAHMENSFDYKVGNSTYKTSDWQLQGRVFRQMKREQARQRERDK